jgi:hypothetical protein
MGELISSLKEQGKAIMVMMSVAIISVLAMIVLGYFKTAVATTVELVNTTIDLFIVAFGITGSFASITVLIIVVKAIVGVVRNLKS